MWETINTIALTVLAATAASSLIGAVGLKVAASWVVLMEIPYVRALITVFLGLLANVLACAPVEVGAAMLVPINRNYVYLNLLSIPIAVLVFAGIIYWRLAIGFGHAVLTTLAMLLVSFIATLAIGFMYALGAILV